MTLLLISFIAGILTVLAPCVLPILPVIIGGSMGENKNKKAPFIIVASLAFSIIVFTLILKVSTAFISIPQTVWNSISGGILIAFGLSMFFPTVWEKFSGKFNFGKNPNKWLASGFQKKSIIGDILMGFSLGPIFSACSPTYFVIIATVLPQSIPLGMVYLLAYVLGLSIMLLLVAFLGQKFVTKLNIATDPHGKFKRGLGVLFFIVGVLILLGLNRTIEASLLKSGVYNNFIQIENGLLEKNK